MISKTNQKKTLELIENFETLKNLEQQKKDNNIIDLKSKKKFTKKLIGKKNFLGKLNNSFIW